MSDTQAPNNGRRRAVLIVGCVAALTLVAVLLGSANPAQAAASLCTSTATSGSTATITVTPCSGLADGGTVTVTGTGFTPSQNVALFMCDSAPTNTDDCDFNGADQGTGTVDASGNLTGTFVVHGTFTTGNGPPAITCNNGSPSPNCTVAAVSSVSTFSPGAYMGVGFGAAPTTTTTAASTTTTTGVSTTTSTTAPTGTTTAVPASPAAAAVTATPTFSG